MAPEIGTDLLQTAKPSCRRRLGAAETAPEHRPQPRMLANVEESCHAFSTSKPRCSCWSSRRRSISARCSSPGARWRSGGTRISLPRAGATSTSATSRRSTRRPTSSSGWPRPPGAAGSAATRSRRRRPRPAGRGRMPAAGPTRTSSANVRWTPTGPSTIRSARGCPITRSCTATPAASPIRSGASAPSAASTSPATRRTPSSGRGSCSRSGSAPFRPARSSSSTSPSPIPPPTGSSGS